MSSSGFFIKRDEGFLRRDFREGTWKAEARLLQQTAYPLGARPARPNPKKGARETENLYA